MKLWLISQDENTTWDTYDSAVVAAETEDEARRIHPAGDYWNRPEYEGLNGWCKFPEQVEVKLLGEAAPDIEPGIVLASFNAG